MKGTERFYFNVDEIRIIRCVSSDRKMLADAKKLQSFKNWQPLEILCMKTILKNFRCLSASPLLEKLGNFTIIIL